MKTVVFSIQTLDSALAWFRDRQVVHRDSRRRMGDVSAHIGFETWESDAIRFCRLKRLPEVARVMSGARTA